MGEFEERRGNAERGNGWTPAGILGDWESWRRRSVITKVNYGAVTGRKRAARNRVRDEKIKNGSVDVSVPATVFLFSAPGSGGSPALRKSASHQQRPLKTLNAGAPQNLVFRQMKFIIPTARVSFLVGASQGEYRYIQAISSD
jgi:hypothetical protein